MWNKDEVKGKAEQAKGAVKEKTGQMIGDTELEREGHVDQAKGAAREAMGTAKRAVKEGVDDLKQQSKRK